MKKKKSDSRKYNAVGPRGSGSHDSGSETLLKEAPSLAREKSQILIVDDKKENLFALREVVDLADSEERYRSTVATVPDIIYRIDNEGRFTFLNEAVRSLGYCPEELIGRPFSEIILPADVEKISRRFVLPRIEGKTIAEGGAPKLFDERRTGDRQTMGLEVRLLSRKNPGVVPAMLHSGGQPVLTVEVNISGLYSNSFEDQNPIFLGTVGVIRDITERKQQEAELARYREDLEHQVEKRTKDLCAREERLRGYEHIVSCSTDMLALLSTDYVFIAANKAYLAAFGMAEADVVGKSACNLFGEDLFNALIKPHAECCLAGEEAHYQEWFDFPVHGRRYMDIAYSPHITENGVIAGFVVAARDITSYKKSQMALQQATDRQALQARILAALNRANEWQALMGDLLEEIRDFTGLDAVGIRLREGDDYPYFETRGFPEDFLCAERYLCECDEAGNIVRDAAGNPVLECMCGNVLRYRTNPALPFFTERGSFWTNSTTQLLATTSEADRQGRTRNRCNSAGYESVALIPLRSGSEIIGLLQLNDRRPNRFTLGLIHFFEQIGESIGIARTRKQTLQALRESEGKLRSILENIEIGVALISPAMEIVELNRKMHEWFPGANPGNHSTCYHTFNDPPRDTACEYCPTSKTLQDGELHEATTDTPQADGVRNYRLVSSPVLNAQGEIIAAIEMVEDITDKVILESQLRQAQKMEAVGQLAGGVAHDFNNILQAMQGYSSFLLNSLDSNSEEYEFAQEIYEETERAAALTRQLLTFSRQQALQKRDLELNDLIQNLLKMVGRLLGEHIDLNFVSSHRSLPVYADPGQLEQVLMNLCINARDAMPEGGRLLIETQDVRFDSADCKTHVWARPGHFAMVSVSDTGCGMDGATLDRIFEPFFTTKELGKGTGLGLSTVFGIIQQHEGLIRVDSDMGKGTAFRIYLPLLGVEVAEVEEALQDKTIGGRETILLAEDDDSVRRLAARILENAGYAVIQTGDGEEAMEWISKHREEIDLLLSDVMMPKNSGKKVLALFREYRPEGRVLFMSGNNPDNIDIDHYQKENVAFISKPFDPDSLLQVVRKVLDRV